MKDTESKLMSLQKNIDNIDNQEESTVYIKNQFYDTPKTSTRNIFDNLKVMAKNWNERIPRIYGYCPQSSLKKSEVKPEVLNTRETEVKIQKIAFQIFESINTGIVNPFLKNVLKSLAKLENKIMFLEIGTSASDNRNNLLMNSEISDLKRYSARVLKSVKKTDERFKTIASEGPDKENINFNWQLYHQIN